MNETIRGQRVNVNVYDDYIPENVKKDIINTINEIEKNKEK